MSLDVAVVVPTHNRLEALRKALRSVTDQSLSPQEVIVVDDMGDSRVRALAAELDSNHPPIRFRYLNAAERTVKGASSSRNDGAAVASATWLAFLDDDDWWAPEFLAVAAQTISDRGTQAFACRRAVELGGALRPDVIPATGRRTGRELGLDGISGSNLVISAEQFKRIGAFDTELTVWEDYDLTVRMLDAGVTLATTDRILAFASADGAGHLSTPTAARAEGVQRFLVKYRGSASRIARHQILAALHGNLAVSSPSALARVWHRTLYLWHQTLRSAMSPSLVANAIFRRPRLIGGPRHYQ